MITKLLTTGSIEKEIDTDMHRLIFPKHSQHTLGLREWKINYLLLSNQPSFRETLVDTCNTISGAFDNIQKYWVIKNGILLPKLFWPTVRKHCSSNRETFLKIEAEGWEFAKFLRSLEQFVQTVKCQNNFW
jgi:hypothetical protein